VRLVLGALEEARLVLDGEVTIQGPLRDPPGLRARAVLPRFEAGVAGVTVAASAPVVLSLENGRLGLDPVILTGEGTRVDIGEERRDNLALGFLQTKRRVFRQRCVEGQVAVIVHPARVSQLAEEIDRESDVSQRTRPIVIARHEVLREAGIGANDLPVGGRGSKQCGSH